MKNDMKKKEAKEAMNELTMMLLYLSRFTEGEKYDEAKAYYAWKGFDFDTLNRLDEEEYIDQGSYKRKSLYLTEKGKEYARKLLEEYQIKDWLD